MKDKEKTELAISKILLLLLAIIGLLFIVWFAWIRPDEEPATNVNPPVDSFEACRAAGYPIQESYPEVCVAPGGQRFTNSAQQ